MALTELQVGDLFHGRYEIQRVIGEGERKQTFLARDTKLDGMVALAVVKPEAVTSDPEGTQREARILRRIGSHDNIVSVFDYDVTDDTGTHYIVFEYLAGGKLADSLQRNEHRSLEQILLLGGQVCQGLAHLHQAGIIHRDVSPANIFFDERGNAHLGDFDSAVSLSEVLESQPVTNNRCSSPEERLGGHLDVRSDLYSIGAVLYLCAIGEMELGNVAMLRNQRPDLPSSFADLVESLLGESPEDRPMDSEAVIRWLEDIRTSDLDALLATEESDTVEFKSSLLHPYGEPDSDFQGLIDAEQMTPQQAQKAIKGRLQWEVTKTVAAFLNTHGGILLVGVSPSRSVLGIEPDFAHLGKVADGDAWQLFLKELVIKRLGEAVWSGMRTSLITHGEKTVAVVSCPRRSVESWHHGGVVDRFGRVDGDEHFYVRIASATHELKGPELITWIREHWF